jgi:hypothetical protein
MMLHLRLPVRLRRILLSTLCRTLCAGAMASALVAAPALATTAPPNQPGFPRQLSGSYSKDSSPTVKDLDGDGKQEIIVSGRTLNSDGSLGCQGRVYAYNYNGALRWATTVRADVNTAAAVADLNGDGIKDVVVGMGGWIESNTPALDCSGGVVALNGANGAILWTFDTDDFGEWDGANGRLDGVASTPIVVDLDRDGVLDIVFGAWDQCIYRLNQWGQPMWGALPYYNNGSRCRGHGFWTQDTVWSSAVAADILGNGQLQIIIGSDISPGGSFGYPSGGIIFLLDPYGNILARGRLNQSIYSSPAVSDLNGDGRPEIVMGTGLAFPNTGRYLAFLHYDPAQPDITQRLVLDWFAPATGQVYASPAIGDLNGDGIPEVVSEAFSFNSGANPQWVAPMYVQGYDFRTRSVLFTTKLCSSTGYSSGRVFGSPIIAQVVGDSRPEVLLSYNGEIIILNPDGSYYTNESAPDCYGSKPSTTQMVLTTGGVENTPAVADLDNNGANEIIASGHWQQPDKHGGLFIWTGFAKGSYAWPMYHYYPSGNALYDNMPPTAPGGFTSTPAVNVNSPAGLVTVRWPRLSIDWGVGVRGYSVVWGQSTGTQPDANPEVRSPANSVSRTLVPGRWYLHVRAVDHVGNVSPVVHVGPFVLR